ncbi:MAG: transcriptional regulator [Asgard group archaeon]|nr:transcriptional regulator [Asgard group archaeon]
MSYLYILKSADFIFLRVQTDLSWGNLSSHITKLEEAGYVQIEKKFVRKKPHSIASLTSDGRKAYENYRQKMKQILD